MKIHSSSLYNKGQTYLKGLDFGLKLFDQLVKVTFIFTSSSRTPFSLKSFSYFSYRTHKNTNKAQKENSFMT